jgi:regulator of protease activity HflC (stomatin/prohibitin superfamily)
MSTVVGRLSLRVQQLDVSVETKTKDNVFVMVIVSVQYRVIRSKVQAAYYKLTDPRSQIRSYVFDTVRSTVPRMELDEAFESKEEVALSVKNHLAAEMEVFGYEIIQALVVDLNPDQTVKRSMNEINASKRLREASQYRADAEKITLVKAAEADAESKYLSGLGVAKQRKAIVSGLQESVHEFQSRVTGTSAKDVLSLLMMTQYFDMLMSVGTREKTTTIFTPAVVDPMTSHVRDGILQAQQVHP